MGIRVCICFFARVFFTVCDVMAMELGLPDLRGLLLTPKRSGRAIAADVSMYLCGIMFEYRTLEHCVEIVGTLPRSSVVPPKDSHITSYHGSE